MSNRFHKIVNSPVGDLTLVADQEALIAVLWETEWAGRVKIGATQLDDSHPLLEKTAAQLREYFQGSRTKFELPLKMQGTEFQVRVWSALQEIPFGETRTYAELAKAIGQPKASRAVGASNGRNPLSIVIPCHRVIGANGKLTGFAGGLPAKENLLRLEGRLIG